MLPRLLLFYLRINRMARMLFIRDNRATIGLIPNQPGIF